MVLEEGVHGICTQKDFRGRNQVAPYYAIYITVERMLQQEQIGNGPRMLLLTRR